MNLNKQNVVLPTVWSSVPRSWYLFHSCWRSLWFIFGFKMFLSKGGTVLPSRACDGRLEGRALIGGYRYCPRFRVPAQVCAATKDTSGKPTAETSGFVASAFTTLYIHRKTTPKRHVHSNNKHTGFMPQAYSWEEIVRFDLSRVLLFAGPALKGVWYAAELFGKLVGNKQGQEKASSPPSQKAGSSYIHGFDAWHLWNLGWMHYLEIMYWVP